MLRNSSRICANADNSAGVAAARAAAVAAGKVEAVWSEDARSAAPSVLCTVSVPKSSFRWKSEIGGDWGEFLNARAVARMRLGVRLHSALKQGFPY